VGAAGTEAQSTTVGKTETLPRKLMNWGKVFAWAVVSLDAAASIGYAYRGDWKRGILWACWSLGTAMVTIQ